MLAKLSPGLRGLCFLACSLLFYYFWQAHTLLVGIIGLAILARRGWDWCRTRPFPHWVHTVAVACLLLPLSLLLLTDTERGEPTPKKDQPYE